LLFNTKNHRKKLLILP